MATVVGRPVDRSDKVGLPHYPRHDTTSNFMNVREDCFVTANSKSYRYLRSPDRSSCPDARWSDTQAGET